MAHRYRANKGHPRKDPGIGEQRCNDLHSHPRYRHSKCKISAPDRPGPSIPLPPVLGIVHAAGISDDNLILNTTSESSARVFSPKISDTLALHKAFPPTTLDFFVLFSSIRQLVGTSAQSPYGAANAFLDELAINRREMGDNAIEFQWTSWRYMGMAADSEFLTVELNRKGIMDLTRDEAFSAWEHVSKYNIGHAVVTRARILDPTNQSPFLSSLQSHPVALVPRPSLPLHQSPSLHTKCSPSPSLVPNSKYTSPPGSGNVSEPLP